MNKKNMYAVVVISLLLIPAYITLSEEECKPTLNLPSYPVEMSTWLFPPDWEMAFKVNITGISEHYDVKNGIYPGWCIEYGKTNNVGIIEVFLYSSYDLPEHLAHENWSKINYILNHRQGDRIDVQRAIWYFVNFGSWDWDKIWGPMTGAVTQETWNMIDTAMLYADQWCPEPGDVIAVICDQGTERSYQLNFIEVELTDYEGATPGFWKNKGVKVGWPDPYTTQMNLENAGFIIPNGEMTDNRKTPVYDDDTLHEALNYRGGARLSGMAQILLRAAVAALLNAAHDGINYPLSETEVLDKVNVALTKDRETMETLAAELDDYNNLGFQEWW